MGRAYEADESGYAKGDRVWVLRGHGSHEPAVVIGHYVAWGSYRVVYMGNPAEREPRAVEEWRLSFRKREEKYWQADTPASEGCGPDAPRAPGKRSRQPERADKLPNAPKARPEGPKRAT